MTDAEALGHQEGVVTAEELPSRSDEPSPAAHDSQPYEVPSFADIYSEHIDFVWRIVRRFGVADKELEDAVQDVFVVVHRRLADFEGRSSIKSWLYGIARRISSDHRRRASRKEPPSVALDGVADLQAPSPREQAARSDALRLVHELLESLDRDKRDAFLLAEIEEMTAPEIAEALGVNVNTVYSRLRSGRKAFEEALRRHHASESRRERSRS